METITIAATAPHNSFPTLAVLAIGAVVVALVAWQVRARLIRSQH